MLFKRKTSYLLGHFKDDQYLMSLLLFVFYHQYL